MRDKNINELVKIILKIKSGEGILDFLKGLLTVKELHELARRLQIVKMLKTGVTQRDIVEKLNVGVATVTRGSKELKNGRFKNL